MARFDALGTARELVGAGMERRQADVVAGACSKAAEAQRADIATKADIASLATKDDLNTLMWRVFAALFTHLLATVGLLITFLDRLP